MKHIFPSCRPFTNTIQKFQDEKGKWHIKYDCDTLGHHESVFETKKEADAWYAELLCNPSFLEGALITQ